MKWLLLLIVTVNSYAVVPSTYSGEQNRAIKALSAKQISAYQQGKGMGLAKAAELNRYPGPRHVLDLAQELALTASQIEQSEGLFNQMQQQAVALGNKLVRLEQSLDTQFAQQSIDDVKLNQLVAQIANIQGQIRFTHLQAHIKQQALLTSQQINQYHQLRGYNTHH